MKKTYLPDINVWLALAFDTHASHAKAMNWFLSAGDVRFAFCRVTQMGFLRIASNAKAFPTDSLTMVEAWRIIDVQMRDQRFCFLPEPPQLEQRWRKFTQRSTRSPNLWADAFLAAFSVEAATELVTFDRGFAQFNLSQCTILD